MAILLPGTAYVIRVIHSSLAEFTLLDVPGIPAYYRVRRLAEQDMSRIKAKQGVFGSDWKFEINCICYEHFITLPVVKMWQIMGFVDRSCCCSTNETLRDGHAARCITRLDVSEPGFAERLELVLAEEEKQRKSRFPFSINFDSDKLSKWRDGE